MRADTSRLRQRLAEVGREHGRQLELLLSERGPLIRGSFGTRARVCGNPGCRCTRGERHESKYLTATDGGKVRQVHVPASDEGRVAEGVARYRRFRRTQARVAELAKLQLELADQLGRSLLAAYPPDHSLPPATRRGRLPRGEADRRG
jgi:uncharacterized protein DUF6788